MTADTVAIPARVTPTSGYYVGLNALWPTSLPPLSEPEALAIAKRLYRMGMGKAWAGPMRITTGHRYTWVRGGTFHVNASRGWHHLVHDVSHYVHWRKHPERRGHDFRHALLEKAMVELVIDKGWLDGRLRRVEKPKPDLRMVRYQRVLARIKAWETKQRRAETALKKLGKQKCYYEKQLAGGG